MPSKAGETIDKFLETHFNNPQRAKREFNNAYLKYLRERALPLFPSKEILIEPTLLMPTKEHVVYEWWKVLSRDSAALNAMGDTLFPAAPIVFGTSIMKSVKLTWNEPVSRGESQRVAPSGKIRTIEEAGDSVHDVTDVQSFIWNAVAPPNTPLTTNLTLVQVLALANQAKQAALDMIPAGISSERESILKLAIEEYSSGIREIGANSGPITKYNTDPVGSTRVFQDTVPWCARFVNWVVRSATGEWPTGAGNTPGSLYLLGKAREEGKGSGIPIPGDIFVLVRVSRDKNGKESLGGHAGFVLRVSEDGTQINTIEGNSGNKIALGLRNVSDIQQKIVAGTWFDTGGFINVSAGDNQDLASASYERGLAFEGTPTNNSMV